MESSCRRARIGRNVLALDLLCFPAVLIRHASALTAHIVDAFFQIVRVELHVLPDERLICAALRARDVPLFLRREVERVLNSAVALDGRRGNHDGFAVPESRLAFLRQVQRIALCSCTFGVAVYLVSQQNFDRTAGKARRAVCSNDGYVAADEVLLHHGVSGESAFDIHQPFEARRVPKHRGNSIFGKRLAHIKGRLHTHDRGRGVVHVVGQHVQNERIGFAYLGRRHYHHFPDVWITDGIHNSPLIRSLVRVPSARFRAGLGGQYPVLVRPLADCQRRWRFQLLQNDRKQLNRLRLHLYDDVLFLRHFVHPALRTPGTYR